MPPFVITGKDIYTVEKKADVMGCSKLGTLGHYPISIASFGNDCMYYIPEDFPVSLFLWSSSMPEKLVENFLYPIKKVLFYHFKVYCLPVDGVFIFCYDPFSRMTEMLEVHHKAVDFQPAGHGFVIEDKEGNLYGYHFNNGVTKVPGCVGARLLGHYKNAAVAILPTQDVFRVTEEGNCAHSELLLLRNSFIVDGNSVVQLDKKNRKLISHGGLICLIPGISDCIHLIGGVVHEPEEVCTLCLCEFDEGDAVILDCGHQFHSECVSNWVSRWDEFKAAGTHVVFTHAMCPGGCKHLVRHPHPLLRKASNSINELYRNVTLQAHQISQGARTVQTEEDLLFYVCHKCKKPFCGGERVCFRMQGGEPRKDPRSLICESCQTDFRCSEHDRDYVLYKCSYCCNPATQRSFGTRYLCERCNARWTTSREPEIISCLGSSACPLSGDHNTAHAYPIGCFLCMSNSALIIERVMLPVENQFTHDGKH